MSEKVIFYRKQGRRYKPVYEYDQTLMDSFPKGTHLVDCYPGGQSRRFNINPAYAPMIAAGRVAQEAMISVIHKASEMRPKQTPITEGQRKAWKKLAREFGDELATLNCASSHDIAEAGLTALQEEADKLLTNPAVKKAYDHFILLCELTKSSEVKG